MKRLSWPNARPWVVLVVSCALVAGIATAPASWHDRLPGLAVALGILVGVLAATLAGIWIGSAVALVGWGLFFLFVADAEPEGLALLAAWLAAAALAGLLADALRARRWEQGSLVDELEAIRAASRDAIVRLDVDGVIASWNRGAETLYGYRADEAIGQPVSELVGVDEAEENGDVTQLETVAPVEIVHRRKDGRDVVVSFSVVPFRDGRGRVVGAELVARDVGEARVLEERVRSAEWSHRALVDQLPLVIYTHALDESGAPLEIGPQVEALLGYSPAEWLAEPELFERLLHPDDQERVLAERGSAAADGKPMETEYRMLARDGRVIWVRDRAVTVRDRDGRPGYRQGSLVDMSWQKRGEEEREVLRAAEQTAVAESRQQQRRLDFLVGASGILASSLDYETNLRRVAELAVHSLADWCAVDVLQEDGTLNRLVGIQAPSGSPSSGRELASEPEAAVVRVVESGRSECVPWITSREAGENGKAASTPLPFASYMCVPLFARGRPFGALTLASDAAAKSYGTDDVALAEDLARRMAVGIDNARLHREVEARADAERVLTYVGDGILLVDRAGLIRLWNSAAEAITGLAPASVLGLPAAEAIPGWQAIANRIPVATSPEPNQTETVPIESERGERWISISGVKFFGGTVYAFRDVTEARMLDELKAEFVATASHELRTPLAAVYGAAQTLRRHDFALDEAGRHRFVTLIVDESERLSRIVNEILLASQLDAGRLDVETEPFDPLDLIDRVVEVVQTHAPPALSLEVIAPSAVPAVAADVDKVRQVLVNLIENAIKYSPDGGTVQIGLESSDETVCFFVRDEGLGIPAEEQSRIFEKFYRLDPDMRRGIGGTGLGLYICSELVNRMDGRIWVESTEGRGSTFYFELPLADPSSRPVVVDGNVSQRLN
jgi:two-component system phosphate regulon sensor histidine kinase PhoR